MYALLKVWENILWVVLVIPLASVPVTQTEVFVWDVLVVVDEDDEDDEEDDVVSALVSARNMKNMSCRNFMLIDVCN